jgi:hypothetical protein
MKNYVAYDPETGEIMSYGRCQCCDFEFQGGGLPLLEAEGNPATHYVTAGALAPYTPAQAESKSARPPHAVAWSNEILGWTYPDLAESIAIGKASLWAQVKARRTELENSPFECDGKYFDADVLSQQRISSAVLLSTLAAGSFSIEWTLADNTTATLSGAELIALGVTLGQRTAQIFSAAAEVRQLIEQAATLSELESISAHTFFV